jgi:hypothetical protein
LIIAAAAAVQRFERYESAGQQTVARLEDHAVAAPAEVIDDDIFVHLKMACLRSQLPRLKPREQPMPHAILAQRFFIVADGFSELRQPVKINQPTGARRCTNVLPRRVFSWICTFYRPFGLRRPRQMGNGVRGRGYVNVGRKHQQCGTGSWGTCAAKCAADHINGLYMIGKMV